jgi:hypothetical protein
MVDNEADFKAIAAPEVPVYPGHGFTSWGPEFPVSTLQTAEYMAQYSADYTVTFEKNAPDATEPDPTFKQVTYDSTYGSLATTGRTGYTFEAGLSPLPPAQR